jgi:hypothetical protein
MTGKKLLYALAVFVFMGTVAGVSIAGEQGMGSYESMDVSLSADPEKAVGNPEATEAREAIETGSLPDRSGDSSSPKCCTDSGEPTVDIGTHMFRPGVDDGP